MSIIKKIALSLITNARIIICLFLIIEVLLILGIFFGSFSFLAYLIKSGIILNDLTYSLFFLSIILFFIFKISNKGKVLLFNLSIIIFLLGATEKGLQISQEHKPKWLYRAQDSPGFFIPSKVLGYAPNKNFVDTARTYWGDLPLCNAIYTTDEYGHRKTPSVTVTRNAKGIVFFGCSFTFGLGLNDDQVMPNILQKSVDSLYKVYNFAYSSYGAHHMLAAIESKMVDTIVKTEPRYFIFQGIDDHVRRAINIGWHSHDPRYIYNKNNGEVEFAGHFGDEKEPSGIMKKIYASELAGLFKKKHTDTSDVKLYIAIIDKSKKLLQQKYPKSEFHMIYYDHPWDLSATIIKQAKAKGIIIHKITDIIPDYLPHRSNYVINLPYESHPNARSNKIVANYILRKIIK
jgi:hypothetical protein